MAVEETILILGSWIMAFAGVTVFLFYANKYFKLRSKGISLFLFVEATWILAFYLLISLLLLVSLLFSVFLPEYLVAVFLLSVVYIVLVFPAHIQFSRLLDINEKNVEEFLNYDSNGRKRFTV